jgi:Rv2525c-like, glycoside hydrolase-like domain
VLRGRVTRASADLIRRGCRLAIALGLIFGAGPAHARPASGLQTIRYHGFTARVPASWPVVDLARNPHACVRFDRHAVYLGVPGSRQLCPAHAAGHRSAILLEPTDGKVRVITSAGRARTPSGPAARAASAPPAHAASVYTGLGFDACSTPSTRTMSAWSSSPYRAIGVYIGGVNSACAQGNLNRSWVATEVSAGWHLIPIYVGLQAPSNSCGCSGITASRAGAQGTAAADDAIADAQGLGIPPGNPIYYDMEAYPTGGSNTSAVLAFLSAWTAELHAKRYVSGVYSSASSGISDLAARWGTGYAEPDDLWIADWNGEKSTSDPYVPSSDWSNHHRLHQYSGDHTESYGGVRLDLDSDYLDGATAGTGGGSGPPAPKPPTLSVSATADGTTSIDAAWSGGSGLRAWRVLAGTTSNALSSVGGATAHGTRTVIKLPNGSRYFAVQALGSSGQVLATSAAAAAPEHVAVFGHSAFVSQSGTGGIPAGCYASRNCHIATTIRVGRIEVARTGTESILSGATGLLYFTLNATGRFMLANAPAGRLPVQVSLRSASGSTATVSLSLIGFSTSGPGPARSLRQAPPVQILGATDFVPARGLGGILASCTSPTPCHVSTTISVGGVTVARTGTETIGGEEAGYLFFPLSGHGRRLLAGAPGNHLQAEVSLAAGTRVARGTIALVGFS